MMKNVVKEIHDLLLKLGLHPSLADFLDDIIALVILIFIGLFLDFLGKKIVIPIVKRITHRTAYKFDDLLVERKVVNGFIKMFIPMILYMILPAFFEEGRHFTTVLRKFFIIWIIYSFLMTLNGLILIIYDYYTHKKEAQHTRPPIRGFVQVIQVILFFTGIIVIISVIINRSPTALFAGLWASAAVFTLVFKDLITGFVAGVQLAVNDMVRPGDWITLNDNQTNGIVEEITLITVKIKNFDNSISTVPPTVLVTNTFRNWREMLESNGRLISRSIFVDKVSVKFALQELRTSLEAKYPLLTGFKSSDNLPTNTDLYRYYMEQYLINRPDVNKDMGLKVGELESTDRGLPILLYFFSRNKEDKDFERIQAEVFDHAMAVLPDFGLAIK